MSLAPAYVSTPWHVLSFTGSTGTKVTATPTLVSTQGALDTLRQEAAKQGVVLDVSPAASGVPKTGH